ncbi:MAG TPA: phage tail protein [Blastocatellia bacterium]|nr:phage tail protein [Blastocatellia bacterium]
MSQPAKDNLLYPLHVFNFEVEFHQESLDGTVQTPLVPICSGAFAECTGLEATMEPKVIKEGGNNYGAVQRAGPVTFATVILKRGMTTTKHLWQWFELVNARGAYAHRLQVIIIVKDNAGKPVFRWQLSRALPIKFKTADLNARGTEVGIEELHLAHEGLTISQ